MLRIFAFIPCLFLFACSSSNERAPVYDVKSKKGTLQKETGTYVARNASAPIDKAQEQYVVQKGDTLYSIAWRANMSVDTLISRNKLTTPYVIRVGQVLQLKSSSKKSVSNSQKLKKDTSTSCTGQSCKGKVQTVLVKKEVKTYPANNRPKKSIEGQAKVTSKVAGWQWPSKGRVIKTFAKSSQGMKGISISGQRGDPVYAAADGKVVYAGNGLRGYGNLIIIKHNYDYLSAYAHNEKIIIKENERVKVGQKIAVMGDSDAESVYLHFDIRYRGKSVDPLRYLPKR